MHLPRLSKAVSHSVAGLAVLTALSLPAQAGAFTGIYFFGDSLTDTGNVQTAYAGLPKLPGQPDVIPGAPYDAEGRASNGLLYADVLAAGLGLDATASLRGGGNYAYGGARTRYQLFGAPFQGILAQVDTYTSTHAADAGALHVLWGGSNNLQDIVGGRTTDVNGQPIPDIAGTLFDIGTALGQLYVDGARSFLVPNVANIARTPRVNEATGGNPVALAMVAGAVQAYNAQLDLLLDNFEAMHPDAQLYRFDTYGFFEDVVGNAAAYGFSNVADRCYTGDDVGFTGGGSVCGSPSSYLFWDGIHPTAAAHGLLGNAMLQAVPEPTTWLLMALGAVVVGVRVRAMRSGA
ncbi:MAG: SGNH/GDSL hydrolase family protein [Burkholderiales bacterium]|nr:SGNH/GDSL hydrolase family protein [Burkholderiales bacterium]